MILINTLVLYLFINKRNPNGSDSVYCADGGVGETRTLAPVNPIYFLSREAPSPTWVLLQSERSLY